MDDAKKLDDAALEDVLREIEALGEITDASRETYVKLETIRQKIRYLKDEDKKTAQDALEEKQSAFDEILAEKKPDGADGFAFKVYDAVIDAAKKEDPSLLTDAALEEVRKVMAQAEKDIRTRRTHGEIGDILAKSKDRYGKRAAFDEGLVPADRRLFARGPGGRAQGLCDMDSDEDLFSLSARGDSEGPSGKGTG